MRDDLVKRLRTSWDADRSIISQTDNWMKERQDAADRIEELEAERDDYAFKLVEANNTYSEMHVAVSELNDKLAKIEALMVRRIKFAEESKKNAGSDNSKRREHTRAHALSDALGEIRKMMREDT